MSVQGAVEAAAGWLSATFGPHVGQFGRMDMISAFNEGANWAERQEGAEA